MDLAGLVTEKYGGSHQTFVEVDLQLLVACRDLLTLRGSHDTWEWVT